MHNYTRKLVGCTGSLFSGRRLVVPWKKFFHKIILIFCLFLQREDFVPHSYSQTMHNLEKQKGKFEDADQEKVNLLNQNS